MHHANGNPNPLSNATRTNNANADTNSHRDADRYTHGDTNHNTNGDENSHPDPITDQHTDGDRYTTRCRWSNMHPAVPRGPKTQQGKLYLRAGMSTGQSRFMRNELRCGSVSRVHSVLRRLRSDERDQLLYRRWSVPPGNRLGPE